LSSRSIAHYNYFFSNCTIRVSLWYLLNLTVGWQILLKKIHTRNCFFLGHTIHDNSNLKRFWWFGLRSTVHNYLFGDCTIRVGYGHDFVFTVVWHCLFNINVTRNLFDFATIIIADSNTPHCVCLFWSYTSYNHFFSHCSIRIVNRHKLKFTMTWQWVFYINASGNLFDHFHTIIDKFNSLHVWNIFSFFWLNLLLNLLRVASYNKFLSHCTIGIFHGHNFEFAVIWHWWLNIDIYRNLFDLTHTILYECKIFHFFLLWFRRLRGIVSYNKFLSYWTIRIFHGHNFVLAVIWHCWHNIDTFRNLFDCAHAIFYDSNSLHFLLLWFQSFARLGRLGLLWFRRPRGIDSNNKFLSHRTIRIFHGHNFELSVIWHCWHNIETFRNLFDCAHAIFYDSNSLHFLLLWFQSFARLGRLGLLWYRRPRSIDSYNKFLSYWTIRIFHGHNFELSVIWHCWHNIDTFRNLFDCAHAIFYDSNSLHFWLLWFQSFARLGLLGLLWFSSLRSIASYNDFLSHRTIRMFHGHNFDLAVVWVWHCWPNIDTFRNLFDCAHAILDDSNSLHFWLIWFQSFARLGNLGLLWFSGLRSIASYNNFLSHRTIGVFHGYNFELAVVWVWHCWHNIDTFRNLFDAAHAILDNSNSLHFWLLWFRILWSDTIYNYFFSYWTIGILHRFNVEFAVIWHCWLNINITRNRLDFAHAILYDFDSLHRWLGSFAFHNYFFRDCAIGIYYRQNFVFAVVWRCPLNIDTSRELLDFGQAIIDDFNSLRWWFLFFLRSYFFSRWRLGLWSLAIYKNFFGHCAIWICHVYIFAFAVVWHCRLNIDIVRKVLDFGLAILCDSNSLHSLFLRLMILWSVTIYNYLFGHCTIWISHVYIFEFAVVWHCWLKIDITSKLSKLAHTIIADFNVPHGYLLWFGRIIWILSLFPIFN